MCVPVTAVTQVQCVQCPLEHHQVDPLALFFSLLATWRFSSNHRDISHISSQSWSGNGWGRVQFSRYRVMVGCWSWVSPNSRSYVRKEVQVHAFRRRRHGDASTRRPSAGRRS